VLYSEADLEIQEEILSRLLKEARK